MKIFYDTEFLEDGRDIDLISIGMIREDGQELYRISRGRSEASDSRFFRIGRHQWLLENVVPHLPIKVSQFPLRGRKGLWTSLSWDKDHPHYPFVISHEQIANEVHAFISGTPDVELWAWYAAYDHVALCQLWGPMSELPKGVPMWTNDLKQECVRLGNPELPRLPGTTVHHALHDARELKFRAEWLRRHELGMEQKTDVTGNPVTIERPDLRLPKLVQTPKSRP